jgi:hypothetical protein
MTQNQWTDRQGDPGNEPRFKFLPAPVVHPDLATSSSFAVAFRGLVGGWLMDDVVALVATLAEQSPQLVGQLLESFRARSCPARWIKRRQVLPHEPDDVGAGTFSTSQSAAGILLAMNCLTAISSAVIAALKLRHETADANPSVRRSSLTSRRITYD